MAKWILYGLTFLLIFGTSVSAQNQNLIDAEYYWDIDPGVGNGSPLTAQDGAFNEAIETVIGNTIGLASPIGVHTFNLRVQDVNSNWGTTFSVVVDVTAALSTVRNVAVNAGEYYWDTDPGVGNGVPLIAFDGSFNESIESAVQNAALTGVTGPHSLNIRMQDVEGNWGSVFSVVIDEVSALSTVRDISITSGEYYWDTDPGVGNGVPLIAQDGSFNEAIEGAVQIAALTGMVGVHTLNLRVRDIANNWGPTFTVVIDEVSALSTIRDISVISGEYYWDADPGQGNGVPLIAQDGSFDEAIESAVQNAALTGMVGVHTLSLRVRDIANNWGPSFTVVIDEVSAISTIRNIAISAGEYYWDNDPGQGNGIPLIAFDGAFDEAIEGAVQNAALTGMVGPHTFNVRVRDIANNWGPVFTVVVDEVSNISTIRSIEVTAAEYFFNQNDPGKGFATPLIAFDGIFNEAIETALGGGIPIPVNAGVNVLSLRVRDAENAWGPEFSVVVNVDTTIFPCDSLEANYTSSLDYGYAGYTIDFINTSINALSTVWTVNGDTISTMPNPSYTFDSAGVYFVNLIVENTGCVETFSRIFNIGQDKFQKTYGQAGSDQPGYSITTNDGGYLLVYSAYGVGQSGAIKLVKLDVFGNVTWQRTLDASTDDVAYAAVQASDSSYYVTGKAANATSGTANGFIMHVDATGNNLWRKTYGDVANDEFRAITIATDGSIIVTGLTANTVTNGEDVSLVKVDKANGNVIWSERYGGPGNENGLSVSATSDGGAIVGATQNPSGNFSYVYALKVTSTGAIDWTLTLPGASQIDEVNGVGETNDGNYFISGVTNTFGAGQGDLFLAKIDGSGSLLFTRTFGTSARDEGFAAIATSDGGFAIAGSTVGAGFGNSDVTLVKTDAAGTEEWSMVYGGTLVDVGLSLSQTIDGGYVIGGYTESFTSSREIYLVRTDSAGSSGCQEQAANYTLSGPTPFGGTLSVSDTLAFNELNYSLGSPLSAVTGTTPCSPSSCTDLLITLDSTICQGGSAFGLNTTGVYFLDTFALANGCDSIIQLNLTVLDTLRQTLNQTICSGQSFAGYSTTGVYVDNFPASNGCDSVRTLNLTVLTPITSTVNQTICAGQSFAGYSITGTYMDMYLASNGCDSTRTLNLTVQSAITSTINETICNGQSFAGYSATGTYVDVFPIAGGCDSTRTLNLTVLAPITSTVNKTICNGQSFAGYTSAGIYVDVFTLTSGCDSTRTLNLTVQTAITSTVNQTICNGQSFAGYSASGTYVDMFTATGGCDSTRTLNLTVLAPITSNITQSICQGQSFAGYTATGVYNDVLTSSSGCDSTRTINLTVLPTTSTTVTETICNGQSFAGYSATGTYTDTYTGSNSCDSVRTLNLTVLAPINTTINRSICQGQTFAGYSSTGTYMDTYTSVNNCDSVRTLNLTVQTSITTTVNETICEGQTFVGYTATGTYIDQYTAQGGCDSIRTLNLTVLDTTQATISQTICEGQSFAGYSATGIYSDTYTGSNGCDSTRVLDLTVLSNDTTTLTESICSGDSFEAYSTTGTYTDVYSGSDGCDSVRVLELTVLPAGSSVVSVDICSGESYLAGGSLQTTTGTYYDTISNAGCDSIIQTDLTVNNSPSSPTITRAGFTLSVPAVYSSYQWYVNGQSIGGANGSSYPVTLNGDYFVLVEGANGCSTSSDTISVINVSVEELLENNISVFPNPTFGQVFIEMKTLPVEAVTIELLSISGQLLDVVTMTNINTTISLTTYAAGVYLVKVIHPDGVLQKRIVKLSE